MRNKLIYCFLIFIVFKTSFAFSIDPCKKVNADTSYTLNSAYNKLIKEYPFIKIPEISSVDSVKISENIKYSETEGRSLNLDLYTPLENKKNLPIVILIHGGGWSSGNKEMNKPIAVYLAKNGFICASVEYRLSPEELYPAGMYDIKASIKWIRQNANSFGADKNKIAIMGFSSGAQMASLAAATNNTSKFLSNYQDSTLIDVQAVINIDGILAFIHPESEEGIDKPGKLSSATRWFGVSKTEGVDTWQDASPLTHACNTFPPVLFLNSKYPRFHAGRDDLISKLDSMNIYSEVHTFSDAPHSFWLFEPWFSNTIAYSVKFLIKVFQNE